MIGKSNKILSTRIRELIAEQKITQNALAKNLGVTRQAISQYCDGSSTPNADKLLKLAQYFNVSADYLIGLSDIKTNDLDVLNAARYCNLNVETVKYLHSQIDEKVKSPINVLFNVLCNSCFDFADEIALSLLNYLYSDCLTVTDGKNKIEQLNFQNNKTHSHFEKNVNHEFWDKMYLIDIQDKLMSAKDKIVNR